MAFKIPIRWRKSSLKAARKSLARLVDYDTSCGYLLRFSQRARFRVSRVYWGYYRGSETVRPACLSVLTQVAWVSDDNIRNIWTGQNRRIIVDPTYRGSPCGGSKLSHAETKYAHKWRFAMLGSLSCPSRTKRGFQRCPGRP